MTQNYLKYIITERRLTYTEIANAVGVTKAAVASWVNKGILPQGEKLAALCDFLKVEPSYLQYGIIGKPGGSIETSDDMVSIPVLDIEGSCGGGRINLMTHMVNMIQVAKSWILARAVSPNFRCLHIINAYGDSMKPLIDDGDFVIVDTSKTELLGDGVYVIQAGDQTFIKRIQRQINGSLLLISDNPAYKPYEITQDEASNVQIIGKAIIACNAKEI